MTTRQYAAPRGTPDNPKARDRQNLAVNQIRTLPEIQSTGPEYGGSHRLERRQAGRGSREAPTRGLPAAGLVCLGGSHTVSP